MRPMRRAVLAILLCAAPLLAAPAHASGSPPERQALREAVRLQAARASGTTIALPGAPRSRRRPRQAHSARVAGASGPVRVLVGVSARRDMAGVARLLEPPGRARPDAGAARRGRRPGAIGRRGGARPARRPAGGLRRARCRAEAAAEPFDVVDPDTGVNYTWAYDAVSAADGLAAAGGGSRRTVAVIDSGVDLGHPELAGRISRTYNTMTGGTDATDTEGHGTFVTGLISAIDGNGIGGKGVAGSTKVIAIHASTSEGCPEEEPAASRCSTCCAASSTRSATAPT